VPGPGRLAYGHVLSADGTVLDEVILAAVGDVLEINCHGGIVATAAVTRRLTELGASLSDGPDPLGPDGSGAVAAELAALLPRAWTELGVRVICEQLDGRLEAEIRRVAGLEDPAELAGALEGLARAARFGRRLTEPARVALAGPPNAGKSTLMNRLLATERVLVYHQPGTTRDVITELASLGGLPVLLSDTAGIPHEGLGRLDEVADTIDVLAAQAAWAEAARAELVLVVFDASSPPGEAERFFAGRMRGRAVFAANKTDAPGADAAAYERLAGPGVIGISALRGDGVDGLTAVVADRLTGGHSYDGGPVPLTGRQREAAEAAADPESARAALRGLLGGGEG
jgi:tRNA modification GTPase